MRPRNVWVVTRREYLSRVRTRAFWLATLVFPVLILAVFALPMVFLTRTLGSQRLAVVDETGRVAPRLAARFEGQRQINSEIARFELVVVPPVADPEAQRRELDRRVLAGDIQAWLHIRSSDLTEGRVEYRSSNVSNVLTQTLLANEIGSVVRRLRLEEAGYDPVRVGDLSRGVELATVRISAGGSRAERGQARFMLAYALCFLLYTILAIYGAQVMNGVLEEKSSRVVELVVSAIRPFELMLGKLIGIGGVGLTQLSIWIGAILLFTAPVGLAALGATGPRAIPALEPGLALHFFAFFLVGYFVYASVYAAIGAAFNSIQEAQQFAFVAVLILIASVAFFIPVMDDPDSTLAVTASLIPIFSPLIMLLRIAVTSPPLWQIALSYALALLFTLFMVWACARIYRVGILMHGRKPSLREIWRWLRYA
jgi:ABC-2 type transport system permease protein